MRLSSTLSLLSFAPLVLAACSSTDDQIDDCSDGKCDVFGKTKIKACKTAADFATEDGSLACTPCANILKDKSGRGFFPAFAGNDALIKKAYMTFEDKNGNKKIDTDEVTCPVDMPGIMAKLDKVDTKMCSGVATRVVSEEAASLGADQANYRAVTSRNCENRGEFGLLFSSFGFTGDPSAKGSGVHISDSAHPGEVEVIAFDDVDGVFNFYKEIGGNMTFFGSSDDFVVAGPGGPGLTNTRGCANCHPGGGLNMKELESPWTNWSLEDNVAGADTLVNSRTAFMGQLQSGANMQFNVTQAGNDKWNAAKAKLLASLSTSDLNAARAGLKDDSMSSAQKADIARRGLKKGLNATQTMLEPLFCTIQVNINNSGGQSQVPSQVFASNRNGISGPSVSFQSTDLTTALSAIGSQVPGLGKQELTTPFMVIEPSHEDESYLNQLVQLGVLDQQLIQDVLMVDFTRPVLSDDRCGLLTLVPDIKPDDRKPAKIRDAILDAVKAESPAAGSAAAQLVANLEANKAGTPVNHSNTLQKYSAACAARPATDVLRDALKMRSLERKTVFSQDGALDTNAGAGVHPYSVFEFEASMPADNVSISSGASIDAVDQVSKDARWNPNDCTLTNSFVAPAP